MRMMIHQMKKTPMLQVYLIKLWIRIAIFLVTAVLYIGDRDSIYRLIMMPVRQGINFMHILWFVFMFMMLAHLFPKGNKTMALMKTMEKEYEPVLNYSEPELHNYLKDQNKRAAVVMGVWIAFNSIFGVLYLQGILQISDLLMLTVFYFLCDYICILFFCPFQTFIMKNKCCVNCRIYDWGHFMMFTPMVWTGNFYGLSLFFVACLVLIHWEIVYAKYPQRFWQGANRRLQCENCRDKTCQIKRACAKGGRKKEKN